MIVALLLNADSDVTNDSDVIRHIMMTAMSFVSNAQYDNDVIHRAFRKMFHLVN